MFKTTHRALTLIIVAALMFSLSACAGDSDLAAATISPSISADTKQVATSADTEQTTISPAATVSPTPTPSSSPLPMVGDEVTFGDFDWLVLDVQDDKALIITADIIGKRPYNDEYIETTWEHSSLRLKRVVKDFLIIV